MSGEYHWRRWVCTGEKATCRAPIYWASASSTVAAMGMTASTLVSLNSLQDTGAYAGGTEPHAVSLAPDMMRNDHAQAHGIHVGNVGEVKDVHGWWLAAGRRLEIEEVLQGGRRLRAVHVASGEGTGKAEDHRTGSSAFLAFDGERRTFPGLGLNCWHRMFLY